MPTLLLTEQQDHIYVVCRASKIRARLWARTRAWDLDRALANGASADSAAPLSLRAERLISRATRIRLEREIRRLVRHAVRPPRRQATAPVCWQKVRRAQPVMEELADHLGGPDPVDAMGVARAQVLLRDGGGPLFNRPSADDLEPALEAALFALEPLICWPLGL